MRLDYFLENNPNLGRFYLLPKIHKILRMFQAGQQSILARTALLFSFPFETVGTKRKFYIDDTNDVLKQIENPPYLTDDFVLCTIDIVSLYPYIPHEEGLLTISKGKKKLTDYSIELSECVIKK